MKGKITMIRVTSFDWGHEGLYKNSEGRLVNGWISNKANSAGGVSVEFSVGNYGTKSVRSLAIFFAPYNGANEPVRCETTNKCIKGVSSHDRLEGNTMKNNVLFENAWYNNSIRSVSIDHIDVTYTDGTTETCKGNYVPTKDEESAAFKTSCLQGIVALVGLGLVVLFLWLLFKSWF